MNFLAFQRLTLTGIQFQMQMEKLKILTNYYYQRLFSIKIIYVLELKIHQLNFCNI